MREKTSEKQETILREYALRHMQKQKDETVDGGNNKKYQKKTKQEEEAEQIDKDIKDKQKSKYQYTRDLVDKFQYADSGFKNRIQKQLNQ